MKPSSNRISIVAAAGKSTLVSSSLLSTSVVLLRQKQMSADNLSDFSDISEDIDDLLDELSDTPSEFVLNDSDAEILDEIGHDVLESDEDDDFWKEDIPDLTIDIPELLPSPIGSKSLIFARELRASLRDLKKARDAERSIAAVATESPTNVKPLPLKAMKRRGSSLGSGSKLNAAIISAVRSSLTSLRTLSAEGPVPRDVGLKTLQECLKTELKRGVQEGRTQRLSRPAS